MSQLGPALGRGSERTFACDRTTPVTSQRWMTMSLSDLSRTGWHAKTASYHSHKRFSGPGDQRRDVAGYVTPSRLEGPWHNYQCKQLLTRLTEPDAIKELGKVFYHTSQGVYPLPSRFVFVAPKGAAGP
jgi:hypothetical protein